MKQRVLSIFLALAIFTTSFSASGIEILATETTVSGEEQLDETPEITVNPLQAGLNDFTERLAAECAITSVQFADNVVNVSYHSNVPGFMQAFIYDEDSAVAGDDNEEACASSNRIAVEASDDAPGDVSVQLPVNNGTVPENFFTEVVFTDKDGEILNSYKDSSNKKSLRMLRAAAEPGSKDQDRIIYIDDTRESYLVLKDSLAIIKDGQSYSINFSDDTVTINGLPQALSDLNAEELSAVEGLVFMLEDAGDASDFKIDSYTSGSYTTVSKNTKNFLPILVNEGESIGVDTINNSVSFKYKPASEMQDPEKIFKGGHFNVDEPILQGPSKYVVNFTKNGGTVKGYISPTVNPKGSIDWDWTNTAVNFGAEIYVNYDLTLSGATTTKKYEWGDVHDFGENSSVGGTVAEFSIPLPPIFTIKVLLTMSALFNNIDQAKGDAHVTGLNYYSFGVAIGGANVNKPKTSSKMQAQANPNQYIEITIDPQIALSGGIDYIFGSYDVITGTISMPLTARFKENPDEDLCIHYCLVDPDNPKGCSEWGQNYTLEGELTVILNYLFDKKRIPSKLDEYTSPVTNSYYSQTYKDKGNGMCPHKGWPVEVTVKYPNGTLAAGATVNVPEYDTDASDKRIRNHSKGTTDKNGKLTIYIPAGDNRVIHAEKGKIKVKQKHSLLLTPAEKLLRRL